MAYETAVKKAMTRYKTWILTDVAERRLARQLRRRQRQPAAAHAARLVDPQAHAARRPARGVDLIEVHNGALSFSVLPTRGMGLWRGEYRGNPSAGGRRCSARSIPSSSTPPTAAVSAG